MRIQGFNLLFSIRQFDIFPYNVCFSSETAGQLRKLYKRQAVVSAEGYALADTIRNRMTLVMSDLDPVQKRSFNDSVAVAVSRRGCDIGDQF